MYNIDIQSTLDILIDRLKDVKRRTNDQDIRITKNNMDINAWYDHYQGNFKIKFSLSNKEERTKKGIVLIIDEDQLDNLEEGSCYPKHNIILKSEESKEKYKPTYEFLK